MTRGLITVRVAGGAEVDMDQVLQRWQDEGLLGHGVGALVHGLLDVLVDGHFEAVQAMDDEARRARGPAVRRFGADP